MINVEQQLQELWVMFTMVWWIVGLAVAVALVGLWLTPPASDDE